MRGRYLSAPLFQFYWAHTETSNSNRFLLQDGSDLEVLPDLGTLSPQGMDQCVAFSTATSPPNFVRVNCNENYIAVCAGVAGKLRRGPARDCVACQRIAH